MKIRFLLLPALAVILSPGIYPAAAQNTSLPIPSTEQLDHIAASLPEKPVGVGRPIEDRAAWNHAASQPAFQKQVKDAEQFAREPIPELNADELFAQVVKTGRRDLYETPFRLRTTRLMAFVVAECVEDNGRYLPAIEAEVQAILAEKTWGVSTQVDEHPFGGFEGIVDLASSCRAWNLATIDYWLGNKLKPETRQGIRTGLQHRIFDRYEAAVRAGKPVWWWMTGKTNWNPVCTSGVLGAALTILDSPQERALFVQAALNSLACFTGAFPADGYCAEGVDYWAYGFGTFLCAAETLYQQTHGEINLYTGANTRQMALFMRRSEVVPGVYPAFGDANPHFRTPPPSLMELINQRWNMGWSAADLGPSDMFRGHPLGDRVYGFGLFGFPLPAYGEHGQTAGSPAPPEEKEAEDKRVFFRGASALICRAITPGKPAFGLALKGGKNGGPHSHIDAGSYVVAYGDVPLVADPGMERYTTKTFGPDRFKSMMMNSYGHSVPFVGKTLQIGGPESEGKIVETQFTGDRDTLKMDLTSAYAVPGLERLTRTYIFHRDHLTVEIIDEADFSAPTDYGSAVVTLSSWKENGPGSFLVQEGGMAVMVTVSAEEAKPVAAVENKVEPITGFLLFANQKPVRLGVNLSKPVTHLVLRTRVEPVVR